MRPSVTQEATLLRGRGCGKGNCRECQSHIHATQKQLAIDGPHQWRGMGGREDGNNRYFIIHFVCLLIAYSISRRKARKKMVAGAKKTQEERLRRESYEVKRKGGESHKKF